MKKKNISIKEKMIFFTMMSDVFSNALNKYV